MVRWVLVLTLLSVAAVGAAAQESGARGANLAAYRQKAAINGACLRLHGKLVYGIGAPQCQLPKVVSGGAAPTRMVPGKPLPVTTRR